MDVPGVMELLGPAIEPAPSPVITTTGENEQNNQKD